MLFNVSNYGLWIIRLEWTNIPCFLVRLYSACFYDYTFRAASTGNRTDASSGTALKYRFFHLIRISQQHGKKRGRKTFQ